MIVTIPFIFLALAASQVTARYVDNGGTNAAAAKAAAAAAAAASQSAIDAPINAAATAGIQTYYSCASASLSPTVRLRDPLGRADVFASLRPLALPPLRP